MGLNHFDSILLSFHKAAHKLLYEVSPEALPPDIVPGERSAQVTIKIFLNVQESS